jgi:hypothetical protein
MVGLLLSFFGSKQQGEENAYRNFDPLEFKSPQAKSGKRGHAHRSRTFNAYT